MRSLLIDRDGVLYVGDAAVPGASEAISWLDESGVPYLYVTNTTSRPRSAIVEKLDSLGFSVAAERILTPPVAAARWLGIRNIRRIALFVPEVTASEFSSFEVIGNEGERSLNAGISEDLGAVVVGDLGEGWDFPTLNRAFRLLMRDPQPQLIALGMTRYWRAGDGLRLDTAPFVMALTHAAGVAPVVLGKPAAAFFSTALSLLGSEPAQTVMIGDDIRTDVFGAQQAGLTGVLVRTGKFRESDLAGEEQPSAVIPSIAELPAWWKRTEQG